MATIKKLFFTCKRYPIILMFFVFLLGFLVTALVTPDRKTSTLDNRSLAQAPTFTIEGFLGGTFAAEMNDYAKDQLPLRDFWVGACSFFSRMQGALESNGVWITPDGYQIAQNMRLTQDQQKRLPINANAVVELARRHPEKVSTLIVPSPANILSKKLPWSPPQINENAILQDMFALYQAAGANVVDVRPAFLEQKEGDLYYKTDHHWTTTGGAWLAYQAFCQSQGVQATLPPAALRVDVPDFFGTNFSKTRYYASQPDILTYYNFDAPLTIHKMQGNGEILREKGALMDARKLSEYDKYAAFLRGNNGYSEIQGSGEGSILLIKDSYGNCFAPYLLQNYAKIGIIDLRYWLSVDSVIEEGGYDQILVLYSFASFSTDMYANRMQDKMQK